MSSFDGGYDQIVQLQQENRRLQKEVASVTKQLKQVTAEMSELKRLDNIHHAEQARSMVTENVLSELGTFTEDKDDMMVVQLLFREVDTDGDDKISLQELETALNKYNDEHHKELAQALLEAAHKLKKPEEGSLISDDKDMRLSVEEFTHIVGVLPRVRGERVLWVRSLGLVEELAQLLEPGTIFDGLSGLFQMSQEHLRHVCDKFSLLLPILLEKGLSKLRGNVADSGSEAQEVNSKFCGTVGAFHGKFATLEEFYQGPEGLIGHPNPKLMEGMEREHCKRESSKRFFVTSNYLIHTTSEWEWFWLQNPASSDQLPKGLQARLKKNNKKYPGDVDDVLEECEVQLSLLKQDLADAALEICKAAIRAHSQPCLELSASVDSSVFLQGSEASIVIGIPGGHDFSDAIRKRILDDLAVQGFKPDEMLDGNVVGSNTDFRFHLKTSMTALTNALHEKMASALGSRLDKQQCLCGARMLSQNSAEISNDRIKLAISVPCSKAMEVAETEWKGAIDDVLRKFKIVESQIQSKNQEYKYCERPNPSMLQKQGRKKHGTFADFFQSASITQQQKSLKEKALPQLHEAEVRALRLYTGPPFFLYNAVLRNFPKSIIDLLRGANGEINKFETTIFVICSGISKLSRLTDVPKNRLLYRGLGGMLLPDEFWKGSKEGFKGAVEFGLMSTTTNRSVAVEYSGIKHKRGILLEIHAGRIDIGASIKFLSQYPGEDEYLMPPLSCMEVISEPKLEKTSHGEILVFPLRVNVNLKILTVEDLTQRRKVLHLSMAKNLGEEILIAATALIEDFQGVEERRALGGVLELISGDDGKVMIASDGKSAKFSGGVGTAGAPSLWVSRGKVFFEVEVLDRGWEFSVGWAGTNFQGGRLGIDESWSIYHSGSVMHSVESSSSGFGHLEKVLGLGLDLESGKTRVWLDGVERAGSDALRVKPGHPAGGALYPVVSGRGGCDLVLNTGRHGFCHAPPLAQYVALFAACSGRFAQDAGYAATSDDAASTAARAAAAELFQRLGLTKEMLGARFEAVIRGHRAKKSNDFNDDHEYKQLLSEVLDHKGFLLAQLTTVIMLRKEGASVEQLKVCADADAADFGGTRLQDVCGPAFLWRSVFSGYCLEFEQSVTIPLILPACQACLIWEAVLASEGVREVKMRGQEKDDEVKKLAALVPSLNIGDSQLQSEKYERALLGLLLACNLRARTAAGNKDVRVVKEVNLKGHSFSRKCILQMARAAAVGHVGGWLGGVNGLKVEVNEALDLKAAVRRDGKGLVGT